jgi:hypothetical protein
MVIGKCAVYTAFFVLGFGTCYTSCVNKEYKIVEENGRMYVQDRNTGRRQKIDMDFKEESNEKGLAKRIDDAYKVLVR